MKNTTFDLIERAKVSPNKIALVLGSRNVSYLDLDASVWGATQYLFSKGVRKGDIIALCISDQFSLVDAFLGVVRLGATALILAPNLTAMQRDKIIADSNAQYLFKDDAEYTNDRVYCYFFGKTCVENKTESYELLCEFPEAHAYIVVGSGSTGTPHLIPIAHKHIWARNSIFKGVFDLKPGQSFMLVSPFYFAVSMSRLLAAVASGAKCVMWDQHGSILQAIRIAQPEILTLTVFHAERILQQARNSPEFDLSGIKIVTVGSAMVSESLRHRMKKSLKANLHIIYGTNEAFILSFASTDDLSVAKDGVGRPPDGVQLEIVNQSNQPVQKGEIGQIRVKTPAAIDSYLDNSSADRFEDGWFYPRDVGKWTEDDQLIHCGRADQMMILDGINIYPSEIENVLGQHPAVKDIAVFPLKDPVSQNIPVCVVALNENVHADDTELRRYALERLGIRTPRHVLIMDVLPRNERGKLLRPEIERLMYEHVRKQRHGATKNSEQASALANGSQIWRGPHRQRMRMMNINNFKAPKSIALEPLDAWRTYLQDGTMPCGELKEQAAFPAETALVAAWFQRILALTRDALLAVNIPCFEHIQLLSCTPASEGRRTYNATIALPIFENYAPRTAITALESAISCAYYMQQYFPDEAHLESQLQTIEKELLDKIRKISWHSNISLRILHSAYRMGIPFRHLGLGVYQLGWGTAARIIDQSKSNNDSAIGSKLTNFKHITAGLLRDAGLPVPMHGVASNVGQARKIADKIGWPVVIKPTDLERGEGVQVDVQPEHLDAAFKNAFDLSKRKEVLVERQVSGVCHRLFVADSQLLYAVKRLPIGVYGDGVQTIKSLVEAECAAQRIKPIWLRSKVPQLDEVGRAAIISEGYTETSIPEQGVFVALRRVESTAWGGIDEDVTDFVHPENLRIALAAAKLCCLGVAGIDIITDQISESWVETGAIINEVNFNPSLGGAEISRRHLPEYISRLMGSDGRIPVDVFVGDEQAFDAAKAHANSLKRQGKNVYVTSDAKTFGPTGQRIPLAITGLYNRVRALVLNKGVEALVIVVLVDTPLEEGLPLEGVDSVQFLGEPNISKSVSDPSQRRKDLMDLLTDWIWSRGNSP